MSFVGRTVAGSLLATLLIYPNNLSAQAIVNDLIAQTVANATRGWPEDCLSLKRPEKPQAVSRFDAEAEPALQQYLALARRRVDVSPAYKRSLPSPWNLNGVATDKVSQISDPWASRVARLEKVGIVLGRSEVFGHAAWRAYSADQKLIGTYEAELVRKSKGYGLRKLSLWSPGQEGKVKKLTPFCAFPGDHEDWVAAKAEQARRKAEKEARKAVAR